MKVYFDFEYNQDGPGGYLKPVCVAMLINNVGYKYWLRSEKGIKAFNDKMDELHSINATLVAWNATAEATALLALGIDPMAFHWIDLWLEYRLLMNDNFKDYAVLGKHYDKGCIFKQPNVTSVKAPAGLEAALFKMLNIKPDDSKYKTRMRNLILDKCEWDEEEKTEIMNYCMSDVAYLPELENRIAKLIEVSLSATDFEPYLEQRYERADYSVLTAYMQHRGYPFNTEGAKRVHANKERVLNEVRASFNEKYPEFGIFEWDEKKQKYTEKKAGQQALAKHLISLNPGLKDKWPMTPTGSYSLNAGKVFEQHFAIKNGWSTACAGKFYHYYLSQKSAFNSFKYPDEVPEKSKRNVLFAKGVITDDNRVHCFMNQYGAKTSRSQPKATSFIFAKPAWLRSLVKPEPGTTMIEIDFGGQELLIQGLISEDKNLIKDYLSEDLYMEFAKSADSSLPSDATKKTHGKIRGTYKAAVLGIGYGMQKVALAGHLKNNTGEESSPAKAQRIIDKFNRRYHRYAQWKKNIYYKYQKKGYLQLRSGWTLFGGKSKLHKSTSIPNFPVQGAGAEIMRKAVKAAFDNDIKVCFTLHDAVFVQCKDSELQETLTKFTQLMRDAFQDYFVGNPYWFLASGIKLEAHMWSSTYKGPKLKMLCNPDPTKIFMEDGRLTGEISLLESETGVDPYFLDGRAIPQLKITGDLVLDEDDYTHFLENY